MTIQDFIYPDYASYPLGGLGNPRYIVIEMHYDNPDLDAGKFVMKHMATIKSIMSHCESA